MLNTDDRRNILDSYIEDNKAILSEIDVCPVCDKKVKND